MHLSRVGEPGEVGSELRVQGLRREAHDLKAAALFGTVRSERCYDNMAAWLERPPNSSYVPGPRLSIAKEMEHGTVVPEVVGCYGQLRICDVSADPLNPRRTLAKTGAGHIQGRFGQVQHRDVCVATIEKIINEGRHPPPTSIT